GHHAEELRREHPAERAQAEQHHEQRGHELPAERPRGLVTLSLAPFRERGHERGAHRALGEQVAHQVRHPERHVERVRRRARSEPGREHLVAQEAEDARHERGRADLADVAGDAARGRLRPRRRGPGRGLDAGPVHHRGAGGLARSRPRVLASPPMLAMVASEPNLSAFQAFVLGAVQGITELLPISSSAHLFLFPTLLGWPYAGVTFDVALHAGTLIALVVAFFGDWRRMIVDFFSPDPAKAGTARDLLGMLAVATLPGLVAGRVLGDLEDKLRSVPLMAALLMGFRILLWVADRVSKPRRLTHP